MAGAAHREELRRLVRGHEPRDRAVRASVRTACRRRRPTHAPPTLHGDPRPRLRRDARQRRAHHGSPHVWAAPPPEGRSRTRTLLERADRSGTWLGPSRPKTSTSAATDPRRYHRLRRCKPEFTRRPPQCDLCLSTLNSRSAELWAEPGSPARTAKNPATAASERPSFGQHLPWGDGPSFGGWSSERPHVEVAVADTRDSRSGAALRLESRACRERATSTSRSGCRV